MPRNIKMPTSSTNCCCTTLESVRRWFFNYIQQWFWLNSLFFIQLHSIRHFQTVNYNTFLAYGTFMSVRSDLILSEVQQHLFQSWTAFNRHIVDYWIMAYTDPWFCPGTWYTGCNVGYSVTLFCCLRTTNIVEMFGNFWSRLCNWSYCRILFKNHLLHFAG